MSFPVFGGSFLLKEFVILFWYGFAFHDRSYSCNLYFPKFYIGFQLLGLSSLFRLPNCIPITGPLIPILDVGSSPAYSLDYIFFKYHERCWELGILIGTKTRPELVSLPSGRGAVHTHTQGIKTIPSIPSIIY